MSSRLAITPGFEAPPVQPAAAAGPALQTTAAQTTSLKDAGKSNLSSVFANLIQELAQEATPRLPAAVANPKTAPRFAQAAQQAPQQAAALPVQSAQELPAARLSPPAQPVASGPAPIELPALPPSDRRTPPAQSTSIRQTAVESSPDVPAKDADKPAPLPTVSDGTRRQPKPEASKPQESAAPITIDAALFMPIAPPITLKLPSFITHPGEGDVIQMGNGDSRAASTSNAAREQMPDLRPAPALELKIRAQDQPAAEHSTSGQATAPAATSTSRPSPTDQQPDTELPSTVTSGAQLHAAEPIVHAFAGTPGPAAIEPIPVPLAQAATIAPPPTPVNPPHPINTNVSSPPAPPPQAPAAHLADEPVSRQPEQHAQPLRSLSLEFAPDGAQDVRVRMTEHAGDVHISLHSTDPALSGRLSDGVHELVGTLASAGYDAQAWNHGQGRQNHSEQNQAPPDDPRRNRRGNSADQGAEDFDTIMQQPIRIKP